MSNQEPHIELNTIRFSDGTEVKLRKNSVLVIVGPNNSGKSAALRAIHEKLKYSKSESPVISEVSFSRSGNFDELFAWLRTWTRFNPKNSPENPQYEGHGASLHKSQIDQGWMQESSGLGELVRWFALLLNTEQRLESSRPAANISLTEQAPAHAIHYLQRDDKLEKRIGQIFRKAFGVDLIVNLTAGSQVPLHVGNRPQDSLEEHRASRAYAEKLEKLPQLHNQGDGMRSFAGVLLSTSVGKESIILIDEPEAFLHPPQANLLGELLISGRRADCQTIIATHSSDILKGLLNSKSDDVQVVRITRSGASNKAKLLRNETIKSLWNDPLLRHSNILDGVFHDLVVVCESDSDCRFYSAIFSTLQIADGSKRPDVLFTHCGGKDRLHTVVSALHQAGVPVVAIADFDILSSEQPLRRICESLELSWDSISADLKVVQSAVSGKRAERTPKEAKDEITKILSEEDANVLSGDAKEKIKGLLKNSSPWSTAKTVGKSFIPSGGPTQSCDRILEKLRDAGLHVVPVGELEGFCRNQSGHGPEWVNKVLIMDLSSSDFEEARRFVEQFTLRAHVLS